MRIPAGREQVVTLTNVLFPSYTGDTVQHVIFFFYLSALAAGSSAIGIAFVMYLRHHKPSLRFFIFFLISLYSFLMAFLVDHYATLVKSAHAEIFQIVNRIFQILGMLLFISIAPFFYHSLMGKNLSGRAVITVGLLDCTMLLFIFFNIISPADPLPMAGSTIVFLTMIAYGLVYGIINFPKIGDKRLRHGILVFLAVTALFFPFFIIDMLMGYLEALQGFSSMNNLTQPLYFLVLSILSIVFCLRYFNEPVYRAEGKLTAHFKTRFGISAREGEIVERLVAGESAKSIGEALFISPKTVENHIYRVFKKCDVKNRLQLHQIISSNTAE